MKAATVTVMALLLAGCMSSRAPYSGPPSTAFLCATADYARNHAGDCRPG